MAAVGIAERSIDVSQMARGWKEIIAESRLHLHGYAVGYYKFSVHTTPGKVQIEDLIRQRRRIAALFGVKVQQVQLWQDPEDVSSEFRLTVVGRDPYECSEPVGDPRGENGVVRLGPHLAGDGEATWRLHTNGLTHSGVGFGGPRTGKSELANLIAVSARATIPTALVFIDGHYGLSGSRLHEHAQRTGETVNALQQLGELEALAEQRIRKARGRPERRIEPSENEPLVLVVIDDAETVFEQRADRWARLVEVGGKTAVSVAAFLSTPAVSSFGRSQRLRDRLMDGNCVAFSTAWPSGVGNSPVRLNELPMGPGAGLCVGRDGYPARESRVRWVGGQLDALMDAYPGAVAEFDDPSPDGVPSVPLVPLPVLRG